jgi:hypothetical protein
LPVKQRIATVIVEMKDKLKPPERHAALHRRFPLAFGFEPVQPIAFNILLQFGRWFKFLIT